MTSGELTHMFLESRPDAWWAQLGRRALHITWAQPGGINLEGLGLQVVGEDQVAQADFILAHGECCWARTHTPTMAQVTSPVVGCPPCFGSGVL